MNPYNNEDVAWARIKDLQREMENARLLAAGQPPATLEALWRLAEWLGTFTWRLGTRLASRPGRVAVADDASDQGDEMRGGRVA